MERVSLAANPQRSSLMPAAAMTCCHLCSSWLRKASASADALPGATLERSALPAPESARRTRLAEYRPSMGTSHSPPSPRRLDRLNSSINRTRPSANRKLRSGEVDGLHARRLDTRHRAMSSHRSRASMMNCCGASFLGGVSFACSGQTNSDFGGTAPTFLYQHLRPSISRQAHQPDLDFGVLRHSIACADEVADATANKQSGYECFHDGFF